MRRGLEFNPEDGNILVLLAQCHNKQQQPEKGEEVIRKQLFIHPNHVPSLIVLIESLLLQQRYIDAEAFLNQAEMLDNGKKHHHTLKKLRTIIAKKHSKNLIVD